ncbi:hypothetical protein [Autumnicola musiva]|uniref:Uncharacterized protein n=1 Tax=Autumnicola musiva TaxID=3075589 RepID=A0ABU3D8S0_9FLAO|nr:hypothetical protein [Zunongwangia sp. F117]MDT0677926.1 hypothetical protein [Zunongwangia sp. F117]
MALFQEWNSSRFADTFFINRREMMNAAKIGAKSTYHRCVRELDRWNYLSYFPSNNPYKGSKIMMTVFGTAYESTMERYPPKTEQLEDNYRPGEGQLVVPSINSIKQENISKGKKPAHEKEVIDFFKKRSCGIQEALTFFKHYQAVGWKMSSGSEILDWCSAAEKWMLKLQNPGKEIKASRRGTGTSKPWDHLKTTKDKNYGESL